MQSIDTGLFLRSGQNSFPVLPTLFVDRGQDLEGYALLEALVCETHTAALQTATTTSAVNALKMEGRIEDPRRIVDFVPHEPPILRAARVMFEDLGLEGNAVDAIETFFDQLGPARASLEQFLADLPALGAARAEVLHRARITSSWQLACRGAVIAVKAFDQQFRYNLSERYAETVPVLVSLLNSAAQGLQPCIDAGGRPFMPELPQRRLAARKALFQECTLRHSRKVIRALARDISTGGLGLDSAPGLHVGELVVVELLSGRRLMGCVAWIKGRSAGIRFGTPLPPNDPLLFG